MNKTSIYKNFPLLFYSFHSSYLRHKLPISTGCIQDPQLDKPQSFLPDLPIWESKPKLIASDSTVIKTKPLQPKNPYAHAESANSKISLLTEPSPH